MSLHECPGVVTALGNDRLQCTAPWTTPAAVPAQIEITGELITRESADLLFAAVLGMWALIFVFRSLARLLRSM